MFLSLFLISCAGKTKIVPKTEVKKICPSIIYYGPVVRTNFNVVTWNDLVDYTEALQEDVDQLILDRKSIGEFCSE